MPTALSRLRAALVLACVCATAFFSGCASTPPLTPATLVGVPAAPVPHHAESVSVGTAPGAVGVNPTQIPYDTFIEAIKTSLTQSGLFAKIARFNEGDYRIEVSIYRVDHPMFGGSFTVTFEAVWRLFRQSDNHLVWEKSISSRSTAAFDAAFAGVTRVRIATEGAARENIKDAIAQMGALTLP